MQPDIEFPTPEEDARIQAGIDADPDNPELGADFFAHAVRVSDMPDAQLATMLPPALVTEVRRSRGPQRAPTKEQVAIRLDRDVLAVLRSSGPGWQGRANDLLRRAMGL